MRNHFTLLIRVDDLMVDRTDIQDHFGVSTEDAVRLTEAGLILDLTPPKLNYLIQKFGSSLTLEVPPSPHLAEIPRRHVLTHPLVNRVPLSIPSMEEERAHP